MKITLDTKDVVGLLTQLKAVEAEAATLRGRICDEIRVQTEEIESCEERSNPCQNVK